MLSLGGEIARTGGNDDYPSSPNHNFPSFSRNCFLSTTTRHLTTAFTFTFAISFFLFLSSLAASCYEPSISMANSRFQKSRLVFVLLCFLFFVSRLRIFVAADDKSNESNKDDGYDFGVTEEDQIGDNSTISGGAYAAPSGVAMDQERSQLCNIDMSSFLPPPYNNISNMVCKPVWNTFLLRYHKKEDNVVTFILSAVYTTGWVAMGFSKDGRMVGSSAMVGWFNRKGQARIKEYYLQGTRPSQVIEDAGELDLTKVPPAVVINGAMIYLAFQAKFEKPLASQPIILAFGTRYPNHYRLSSHDDKTAILFDFTAGSASGARTNAGQMKKNHGVLGTLAWGLFLPSGAIVARYLKHKEPLWYYLHAGIQFLGFLLGLANVVLGQQLYSKIDANVSSHRGIGIFALTLSILQILAFFLRPKKDAKIRKYWNWYHHWFGRIALFFGVFNILWGIHLGAAGTSWKIGFGFLITMILVTVIILETLSWLRRSEKTTPPETCIFSQDFQLDETCAEDSNGRLPTVNLE